MRISAAAVSDDATATGLFSGAGIAGVDGQEATITAGSKDDDISRQVFVGTTVLASTTGSGTGGGDATATISTSNLFGIRDVNLIGGEATRSNGLLGSANGRSDVNAYGIFGGPAAPNTIVTIGDVSAIARLSNTVTASTVRGNATAIGGSNADGISNTNIHKIGSGIIKASAFSNTSRNTSSVRGHV